MSFALFTAGQGYSPPSIFFFVWVQWDKHASASTPYEMAGVASFQWLPQEQLPQPQACALADEKSEGATAPLAEPELVAANSESKRRTSSAPHFGQCAIRGSPSRSNSSNFVSQWLHKYS
jgi:hypothetical protein